MPRVYSQSPSEVFFAYEAPGPASSAWERVYVIHAYVKHKAVVVEYWQKMPGDRFDDGPHFDNGGRRSFEAGHFVLNPDGSLGKTREGAVGLLDPGVVLTEVKKLRPDGWRPKQGFGPLASRVATRHLERA
jgi:hypothetical protein